MTQTNMVSFKQTHANGNNSNNKSFTTRLEQIFRCYLKTTLLLYENQILSSEKLQALLLSLEAQKTQDDSWFYYKQVPEMHQRTLPEAVVYQGHVDKREVLPRHRCNETRILLIYVVAFS